MREIYIYIYMYNYMYKNGCFHKFGGLCCGRPYFQPYYLGVVSAANLWKLPLWFFGLSSNLDSDHSQIDPSSLMLAVSFRGILEVYDTTTAVFGMPVQDIWALRPLQWEIHWHPFTDHVSLLPPSAQGACAPASAEPAEQKSKREESPVGPKSMDKTSLRIKIP